MYAIVKCAFILCAALTASSWQLDDTDVVFHLYTVSNPSSSEPLLATVPSIMLSSFSLTRRTVITIHDSQESAGGNFNAFLVGAELNNDVNVIAVDWSPAASLYTLGLANAPKVGQMVGTFMDILINNFGYSASQFRLVGHGLGGHIAGIAARQVGNIPHIIALDPSLRGWSHHPDKLNADDAETVEVLHTTAGFIGYDYPLGDVDFYANGGSFQNGCFTDTSCSLIYAYIFYAESVSSESTGSNRFIGTKCDSYEDATILNCSGDRDIYFGGTTPKTGASGIYIFTTNAAPPFARN